jgi:hypothetical protein
VSKLESIADHTSSKPHARHKDIVLLFNMGLFGSAPVTLPPPKISSDGAPIAPDRTQRAKCWEGRDGYFSCLDKNNIIDSITEKDKAEKFCSGEGMKFEANCASSWVSTLFGVAVFAD